MDKGQSSAMRVLGLEDPMVTSLLGDVMDHISMLYTCQPAVLHSATEDISLPPSVQLYALWLKNV